MKTSTKIFIGYGIAIALLMVVCLSISTTRYHRTKPMAEKLLEQFASTRISSVVVTEAGTGRPLTLKEGNVWLNEPAKEHEEPITGRNLVVYNRLDDVRISGDTIYITAPASGKPWPIRIDLPELKQQ